jgi:lysine 6-dehydrogenase
MVDIDHNIAEKSAQRINQLIGDELVFGIWVDVSNQEALIATLQGVDVTLSAVPYYYNLEITKACIKAGSSMCDMGGHTGVVQEQLAMDAVAKAAGISIVPDCGMGPGLNVTMAAYAQKLLDACHTVNIFDGGLPQKPQPPWNYQATFHINGLTNEMDGQATFIKDGEIIHVDTLSEPEMIDFSPIGQLEADVTSGGLSTSPWSFHGKLQNYSNKTLRYPGHFEWLRAFKALGLFSEEALPVNGYSVIPRQVYHTLLEPKISVPEIRDVCVMRVNGYGVKDGKEATVVINLIDYYDEKTGFTAMERLTGWHCAIMMGFQARGKVPMGGSPWKSLYPLEDLCKPCANGGSNLQYGTNSKIYKSQKPEIVLSSAPSRYKLIPPWPHAIIKIWTVSKPELI